MPKFFVKNNQIKDGVLVIQNQDNYHIKKVLRKKVNDEIVVCDNENRIDYICKIISFEEEKTICKILKENECEENKSNIKISIFQGIPKSDKMELIIQKSVELGMNDITPVIMERCIVKLTEKDKIKKIDRWKKISEVAAKQSGRNIIPNVNECILFRNIESIIKQYDMFIVAYENEKENTLKNQIKELKKVLVNKEKKDNVEIAILIGPEGGITKDEIDYIKKNNGKIITLGTRILRTETVALNMISILMYEFEN